MNILSKRFEFGDDFTLSNVLIDGVLFNGCPYILEDKVREVPGHAVSVWKLPGITAIPVGKYKVVLDFSTRFKKQMLHLLDVQGYSGIRVHAGTTSLDTDGCMVTGLTCDRSEGEVHRSRIAYKNLFVAVTDALATGEEVWWEVQGLPP